RQGLGGRQLWQQLGRAGPVADGRIGAPLKPGQESDIEHHGARLARERRDAEAFEGRPGMSEQGFTVDRRVTLKWLFGAIAASGVPLQGAYAAAAPAPWPVGTPAKIDAPGYGTDPKMLEPVVPWPK